MVIPGPWPCYSPAYGKWQVELCNVIGKMSSSDLTLYIFLVPCLLCYPKIFFLILILRSNPLNFMQRRHRASCIQKQGTWRGGRGGHQVQNWEPKCVTWGWRHISVKFIFLLNLLIFFKKSANYIVCQFSPWLASDFIGLCFARPTSLTFSSLVLHCYVFNWPSYWLMYL